MCPARPPAIAFALPTTATWYGLLAAWSGAVTCPAQPPLGLPDLGLLLFGSIPNPAGGLPLPPPAVAWQIPSGPELASFGGHHLTTRLGQRLVVQQMVLAYVPHASAHPASVVLKRIAPGRDGARLPTDPSVT